MQEDHRETWGAEQWVIDHLVEAVDTGGAEDKLRYGTRLLEGYSRHDWKRRMMVGSGIILLHNELDATSSSRDDIVEILEMANVPETRLEQISQGAPLTESEVRDWQERVMERAFD